ncbi:hypothetical protein SAMN04488134_101107 [Amphibacillus marinus]|uniref:TPM domain-containing protein n=1 Tax=Amphibacillus marinus TaxID=872970 RepID=A0A1H8GM86_9BACI|nr:hypothetical protein [Amphibacillus marinus]SEN44930.1 hypothetical protein SAMN04488134_101107 [Amphibacillus marinus]
MGRGGRGGGRSGGRSGGSFGGGSRGGSFGGSRGGAGRMGGSGSFGSGKKRGSSGSGSGFNRPSTGGGYRPRTGGFFHRPYYGRPRWGHRRYYGGGGGCFGCGSSFILLPIIIVFLMIFLVVPAITSMFGGGGSFGSNSITPSTVDREPLPSGVVNETDYYTDEIGLIFNETVMLNGLRHFYNETGVQPHVYITDEIDGSLTPTFNDIEVYTNELYDELFTDEAHLLLLYFDPYFDGGSTFPEDYAMYAVTGTQAKSVIDTEAANILLDYLDRYYYDDIGDEEYFSRSFQEAADRIMEVTRSPWIPVLLVFAVVVILVILFSWWRKKQQQKDKEAKQTEEMLNKPISTFGKSNVDDLSSKYDDSNKE